MPWSVSGGCGGDLCERVEDDEPLEVGDGGRKQRLQPCSSPAAVAGLAHAEVLKVVDLAFDLGAPAQQRGGGGLGLRGAGSLEAVVVSADDDAAPTGCSRALAA